MLTIILLCFHDCSGKDIYVFFKSRRSFLIPVFLLYVDVHAWYYTPKSKPQGLVHIVRLLDCDIY